MTLISHPPFKSGKTSTLVFVARLLAARGKRVLITSYTHSAVDNVVIKLMESGLNAADERTGLPPLARVVGDKKACHPGVRSVVVSELAIALDRIEARRESTSSGMAKFGSQEDVEETILPSARSLRKAISSARIVCTTALSVPRSPLLNGEEFDTVIVDEAGQISQPAVLGALMAADSFVLVGDHLQLPPLVNSELAEQGGKAMS